MAKHKARRTEAAKEPSASSLAALGKAATDGRPAPADAPKASDLPTVGSTTILMMSDAKGVAEAYSKAIRLEQGREQRYKDYEAMLEDALCQSGMELIAEDAAQPSRESGKVAWFSGDAEYAKEGEELASRLALDEGLPDWALWLAAYGDWFVEAVGEEGKGVVSVSDAYHPLDVARFDLDGRLVGFSCEQLDPKRLLPPWRFIHFRCARARRQRDSKKVYSLVPATGGEEKHRYTTTYGLSALEAARKVWKQLDLVERLVVMARVARAPLTNVVQVNTGNLPPDKRADLVHMIEERFKRDINIDISAETYQEGYHIPSMVETVTLPVMGDAKGQLTFQQVGGDTDVKAVKDLEYLQAKFFAALRIPPAMLGNTKDLPSSLGQSALVRLEIRYARVVKKVQLALLRGLARLFQIDRAWRGKDTDLSKLRVEMQFVSTAEEEEAKASLGSGVATATALKDLFDKLALPVDARKFWGFLDKNFLHLGARYEDIMAGQPAEGGAKKLAQMLESSDFLADTPFPQTQEAWTNGIGRRIKLSEIRKLRR